jgi:hypothetical protein
MVQMSYGSISYGDPYASAPAASDRVLAPAGIASRARVRAPEVIGPRTLQAIEIASRASVGTPTLNGAGLAIFIAVGAIAPGGSFGDPAVLSLGEGTISPAGWDASGAIGTPTLSTAATVISPIGIPA